MRFTVRPRSLALVAAAVTAVIGLSPAGAGAAIVAPPAGIPANCSVDVTARLQAAIDATPDGATLQFPAGGCYRIDGTLIVKDRTNLTIDGGGATFRQVTNGSELVDPSKVRARAAWLFVHGSGLTMRNAIVIGANPAAGVGDAAYQPRFEGQAAYWIQASRNVVLDRVQAYDTYGDFVYVAPGTDGLLVRNSTFRRNGRQGWTINGSNITFDHNVISDTRRATIDIEPTYADWSSHNVTISNNIVGRGRDLFLANVGNAQAVIDGVTVIGNQLQGKAMQILAAGGAGKRSNYHVIGNTSNVVLSGSGAGIAFRNITGAEVRNNVQPTQATHRLAGVTIRTSSHVTITGNRWDGAKSVWVDRGGNVDVRQSGNAIGHPMTTAPATVTVGPTPLPTG